MNVNHAAAFSSAVFAVSAMVLAVSLAGRIAGTLPD